jgi:hypothetical protein
MTIFLRMVCNARAFKKQFFHFSFELKQKKLNKIRSMRVLSRLWHVLQGLDVKKIIFEDLKKHLFNIFFIFVLKGAFHGK